SSSLLMPKLLRVDGATVRLLELQVEADVTASNVNLRQLGQLWSQWATTARPNLTEFLGHLSQNLIQGQIQTAEQLVEQLDRGLAMMGRSHSRSIHIATRTDQGPTRKRNEDACYPPSHSLQSISLMADAKPGDVLLPLVIVCDGIGGHQGGDVASNLAIETLKDQLHPLLIDAHLSPAVLMNALERAICAANDVIAQRNDQENRQERQRMGTTVVLVLAYGHELYIAHVGDSRAYWINAQGCRQVTMDDDVASREVRLGYTTYQDALQHPGSGSLVQALGMGPSSSLYPSVQRLVLDEDSIFLICSDGLSDNDRVEQHWATEILPILEQKRDLAVASQQLVNIANTCNGYDNVTVGLVHCQVSQPSPADLPILSALSPAELNVAPVFSTALTAPTAPPVNPPAPDQSAPDPLSPDADAVTESPHRRARWPFWVSFTLLVGIGGIVVHLFLPTIMERIDRANNPIVDQSPRPYSQDELPELGPTVIPTPTPALPPDVDLALDADVIQALAVGALIQVRSTPNEVAWQHPLPPAAVDQAADPAALEPLPEPKGMIPAGSILKVLQQQQTSEQILWLQLKVCSIPAGTNTTSPPSESDQTSVPNPVNSPNPSPSQAAALSQTLLQPDETGWIKAAAIATIVDPVTTDMLDSTQRGTCLQNEG
ncbi:MAG: SpoIIE family protein phosphatase, partial [Cyanothece sp. SIO1E1]|nr:SpoIIE family protein phosphatase [Cyanothece sp. SIO1E1]